MSITIDGSANTITSSAASISVTKPVTVTSIQNTPIGSTTASTGAFTTMSAASGAIARATGNDYATASIKLREYTGTGTQDFSISNISGSLWIGNGTASNALSIDKTTRGVAVYNGIAVTGAISATTTIKTGGYTVGTLPAGTTGDRAYVTDATAPTYLGALTGGGAVVCPVFKNASAWVSA